MKALGLPGAPTNLSIGARRAGDKRDGDLVRVPPARRCQRELDASLLRPQAQVRGEVTKRTAAPLENAEVHRHGAAAATEKHA
jgi:hypothetical protein